MVKKMIQHGNSLALVIDKPILELLKLSADTTFKVTTDGTNLILSPQGESTREGDILASLAKVNGKFAPALKRLGE